MFETYCEDCGWLHHEYVPCKSSASVDALHLQANTQLLRKLAHPGRKVGG